MAFEAKVVADSLGPTGDRLTTVAATYPRIVHSELLTHRVFSRSSASSRAIPVEKMLARITEDPFVPIHWGANQAGMQAGAEIEHKDEAWAWWLYGQMDAVKHARRGIELGLHKQIVNRVVEPYMWITVLISSTTWSNFRALRVHPAAEPHLQKIAGLIVDAIDLSEPKKLHAGEWHRPYFGPEEQRLLRNLCDEGKDPDDLANRVSAARCARVSYLNHEGRRDVASDLALFDKLAGGAPLHASPLEHVAQAMGMPQWFALEYPDEAAMSSAELNKLRMDLRHSSNYFSKFGRSLEAVLAQLQSGNFRGWRQFRKTFANEHAGEPMP